jgi:hypothetical protein
MTDRGQARFWILAAQTDRLSDEEALTVITDDLARRGSGVADHAATDHDSRGSLSGGPLKASLDETPESSPVDHDKASQVDL